MTIKIRLSFVKKAKMYNLGITNNCVKIGGKGIFKTGVSKFKT